MLQTKERTPIPYPSIVFTLDSQLSLSRSLGVRQEYTQYNFHKVKLTTYFSH